MKTLFTIVFLTLSQALASGWMDVRVLPHSVFTEDAQRNEVFALFKEKSGVSSAERYECRLSLKADSRQLEELGQYRQEGSWIRWVLQQEIYLQDREITNEMVLTPDLSSRCLAWGEEYYDDGYMHRDCLQYEGHIQTMKNTLRMIDTKKGVEAYLTCEKWRSAKAFDNLDQFFHLVRKAEGNFPLFLKAELD
ncbi:hypothetical protein [Pseudobdellovibrio exovorus]|uniref:Uncharacterized protein n=1 Tax=Pseudobdellovibrio exovorus JSS TaxID=1184267 RepID=M4V5F3_9BACT|nr:hypothetical protein [Pseudobdellovibrio exovorus]AGH94562.1 hypothetical protein A11Q_342 [Pseudobdellovibrio exovorus JSS]